MEIDYSKEAVQGRRIRGRYDNQNKQIEYVGEDVEVCALEYTVVQGFSHADK